MIPLEVNNLTKIYPSFKLDNVSFSLEKGKITGFIGRNGAGKTTTLKSILNFVHPDSGEIEFFGLGFSENEDEIKHRIGFVSGSFDFYSKKKIKTITSVTRKFYDKWDQEAYVEYMKLFNLDENKMPSELSEGMKVKYSLVLALSHNAELLILDEPTSGLDPVSRDELLEVFLNLSDLGITILFSTHITSDLDKCADNIVYIKKGKIIAQSDIKSFTSSYKIIEFKEEVPKSLENYLIGLKRTKEGHSAIIKKENSLLAEQIGIHTREPDLEEIMVHMEKDDE